MVVWTGVRLPAPPPPRRKAIFAAPRWKPRGVCISACGSVSAPVPHSDAAPALPFYRSPCYQRSRGALRAFSTQGDIRSTPWEIPAGCLHQRLRLLPHKVSSLRSASLRYFAGTPSAMSFNRIASDILRTTNARGSAPRGLLRKANFATPRPKTVSQSIFLRQKSSHTEDLTNFVFAHNKGVRGFRFGPSKLRPWAHRKVGGNLFIYSD